MTHGFLPGEADRAAHRVARAHVELLSQPLVGRQGAPANDPGHQFLAPITLLQGSPVRDARLDLRQRKRKW